MKCIAGFKRSQYYDKSFSPICNKILKKEFLYFIPRTIKQKKYFTIRILHFLVDFLIFHYILHHKTYMVWPLGELGALGAAFYTYIHIYVYYYEIRGMKILQSYTKIKDRVIRVAHNRFC